MDPQTIAVYVLLVSGSLHFVEGILEWEIGTSQGVCLDT
jgi:hypothetical protein